VQSNALADKCIVIIGGTSGLGLSAARACAAAGAKLVVIGRDDEHVRTARTTLGNDVHVLVGDATVPRTSEDAISAAVREFGRLDGLYHVAGGSGRRGGDGPLDQISDEGWAFTQKLNLDSLFYSNRAAARQFLKQKSPGSVLNVGSVLGFSPSPKHFATHSYAAAKAAIIGLTKSAAAYYAPHGIRFNVIAPALVETPMAQRAVADPSIMGFIKTKQPLDGGRIGQCSDLDAAVVFFLSDESKFVTGQVLAIDGGWSVSDGPASEDAND